MTQVSENRTVTATEARRALVRCFKHQRPVFLWGPPGIGKSELVASIAAELGGTMIDLRLSQMEPTDLRGIPFFNKDNGKMDWAPPIELPDEEMASKYPIIVLFLDELTSAAPAVQAGAYQLILNRCTGKYKLPKNVVMVAAGNRESDKGVTYRMPSPLSNRFVHLEMRVDFESWHQWAVQNRIHKDVVGYVSFAKQDLYDFDPRSSGRSFATPRSWTFVSELLDDDSSFDSGTIDLISGAVGEGIAVKFMAHRKVSGQMPDPVLVLDGKITELKIKEISAMYSLSTSLCYELKDIYDRALQEKNMDMFHEKANNFFKFIMENFTTELVVMASRIAITTYKIPFLPAKIKCFEDFFKRFGKYVVAAVNN